MNRIYESYGCSLNVIRPSDLFARYIQTGFLYPTKWERVAPWIGVIKDNWDRALRLGDQILQIIVYEDLKHSRWGTLTSWRHVLKGWLTQHLAASGGGGVASRAVMLAGQVAVLDANSEGHEDHEAHQNWFRRSNPFANRVFGTAPERLGSDYSCIRDCILFEFPAPRNERVRESKCSVSDDDVKVWLQQRASSVFLRAEGLDRSDLEMRELDAIYDKVGLRRYRRVFVVFGKKTAGIAGVALAYRGPLGFNLSFLENRCDIMIDPKLDAQETKEVVGQLLAQAASVYSDLETGWFPVVIDNERLSDLMIQIGGKKLISYAQCCWLRASYPAMMQHIDSVFETVSKRQAVQP